MKILKTIALFCGLALVAVNGFAVNAQDKTASAGVSVTPTPVNNNGQQAQSSEKDEKKDADKDYREMFDKLLDRTTWVLGVIGAIVLLLGGIIVWLVKWTLKETREDAKKIFEAELQRRGLNELDNLQRQVSALNRFKDRRIDWVYPANSPAPEKEKQFFLRMGLAAEHVRLVMVSAVDESFILNNPSLVILNYDASSEKTKALSQALLEKIVPLLQTLNTPLLVYTLAGARLEIAELTLLSKIALHATSNYPATVVTQALELIRLDQP